MPLFRRVLSRLREETLVLVLVAALIPLLVILPEERGVWMRLVDWKTVGALAGLMVLSRGLEESGYLAQAGAWLLSRVRTERMLAAALVLFSAMLSAAITNDVALFIVVPLTLGLRAMADLPTGRLVVFEALAVNAGSAASPVGNPQNLLLWQASGTSFVEFALAMLPLGVVLVLLLLALLPLAFPARSIDVGEPAVAPVLARGLFMGSLLLYPVFLLLIDLGFAVAGACALVLLYLLFCRRVLRGVDWLLLVVFVFMFVDLGLLARLPAVVELAAALDRVPGEVFTAGVLLSQAISNVPAAIFLQAFTEDWRLLAWGVSVGGFGLAIGSLANLIALRLARQRGLWLEFHLWSIPVLAAAVALAMLLLTAGV